jgi:hypothetical protein
MDDFIHGRHRGRETKGSSSWSSSNLLALWHMQTENENLENNNMNHGYVLLHGIMLLFCREGKMPLGACSLMQMKKISVLKLTKQRHES